MLHIGQRRHNPFINSAAGGRALSAIQLPFFQLLPPTGYGVLTTTGRNTGKTRRRCLRVVVADEHAYLVAIKGIEKTGWAKNAVANPQVRLRVREGTRSGRVRELRGEEETRDARAAYCETVGSFDYLTFLNWRTGHPTVSRIEDLLRTWFDTGTPLAVDLGRTERATHRDQRLPSERGE